VLALLIDKRAAFVLEERVAKAGGPRHDVFGDKATAAATRWSRAPPPGSRALPWGHDDGSPLRQQGIPEIRKDGSVLPQSAVAATQPAGGRPEASPERIRISLLGTFDVSVGDGQVALPMNVQRLVAFLALQRRWVQRGFVAGSLWLDSTDDRAAGSLRSALWRANREARFVEAQGEQLRLLPAVNVDLDAAVVQAHRLLDPASAECPSPHDMLLRDDVLPDWYDDWVALERERFRQLRVHALESLCERLMAVERFGEAIDAGLAATATEPLRESGHRLLVRIHLAEGNSSEALARFKSFRAMLLDELGLEPSPKMFDLVAHLTKR